MTSVMTAVWKCAEGIVAVGRKAAGNRAVRAAEVVRGGIALLAVLLGSALPARGQQVIEDEGGGLQLTFDEVSGTELSEFLQVYQRQTGMVIQYTPSDIEGVKINQLGTTTVKSSKRLEVFFGAVLRNLEFLLVQFGPEDAGFWSLRKIQTSGARSAGFLKALARIVLPSELEGMAENPGILVTTSYTTKYLPAREAMTTLQPYFSDNFTEQIRSIEGTDTILMTGFANTLAGIYRLLKEIDRPPEDYYPLVRYRELLHADADEIQDILEELISAYMGSTRGSGGVGGRRAAAPNQAAPGAEPEPSVIADPRTSTLIVTAGADTMVKIMQWISDLDVEVDPRGDVHVYRLRSSRASNLQQVLTDVMAGTERRNSARGGAAAGGGGGGGAVATPGTTRTGEQPVSIIADDATNSLIITASKTRYAQVLEIIRKLDVRPAQVLIQAALIEVSKSLGEAIGVELTAVNIDADDQTIFGLSSFGLTDLIDTDTDGFPDGRALPNPLRNGLTGGIFDPQDFPLPFVLNALANSSEANVLSLPSILTNDNESATITAQDSVPFTQTNQGQNSDTTSLGGTQDAGIELTVSPSISAGGYLRLNINLVVSAFSGDSADASLPPPSLQRTIEATVTIPDGHTMIIGGVMTNDSRRGEDKIPILGDLPLIGFLFRNTNESASKTNLYFFLTPYIIADDFATLDELTRLHIEEAEKLGGQVDLLNRFNVLSRDDLESRELSRELLERAFELPSYASIADELAPVEVEHSVYGDSD